MTTLTLVPLATETATGTTIGGAQWINVAVNILLPALVALVTKQFAPGHVKALTLLLLSAISGVLISILAAANEGVGINLGQLLFTTGIGYLTAVLAHFGLLKPLSITGSDGAIATSVPGGLGSDTIHSRPAEVEAQSRRAG